MFIKETEPIGVIVGENKVPEKVYSEWFLGHTRNASNAATSDKMTCAHPFLYNDWLVAHNGYFPNWQEVLLSLHMKKEDDDKCEIDSHVILPLIAKKGWDGLKELTGWGACWFIDKNDDIFLWNSRAELSYYIGDDMLVFSSDDDHIKVTLDRDVKCVNVKPSGELIKIDKDKITVTTIGEYETKKEVHGSVNIRTGQFYHYDDEFPAWNEARSGFPIGAYGGVYVEGSPSPMKFKDAVRNAKMASSKWNRTKGVCAGEPKDINDCMFGGIDESKHYSCLSIVMQFADTYYCPKCKYVITPHGLLHGTEKHCACKATAFKMSFGAAMRIATICMATLVTSNGEELEKLNRQFGVLTRLDVYDHIKRLYGRETSPIVVTSEAKPEDVEYNMPF
jgi:hypothetical protein